ncbi:hypothetical protein AVEN_124092-1 [Araneus ventricosus]|uniref:Uncharacterized protein n=1 Tax=Araneus ventricosus TaxID=182803 RepID=A0A4Y2EYR9_ARAVE|nr:hypothetical protein AVEN_124092-1 [Araneus ventricosus]
MGSLPRLFFFHTITAILLLCETVPRTEVMVFSAYTPQKSLPRQRWENPRFQRETTQTDPVSSDCFVTNELEKELSEKNHQLKNDIFVLLVLNSNVNDRPIGKTKEIFFEDNDLIGLP